MVFYGLQFNLHGWYYLYSQVVNWEVCCLCQCGRGVFVCPANNVIEAERNKRYMSLAANLEQLRPYKYRLQWGLVVEKLDEGDGILETFKTRKAKWYKSCAMNYLNPKFEILL